MMMTHEGRDSAHLSVVLSTLNLSVLCSHSDMGEAEMRYIYWCSLEEKFTFLFIELAIMAPSFAVRNS